MKMINVLNIVLLVVFFFTLAPAQELSEENKKAMEQMEKLAAPGENHKHLDYFVGNWDSLVKMFAEPGAEPIVHKQDITVKWILGGRYLNAVLKGNLLGKDYEVLVLTGYDNSKKKVFAIQLSTMDTGYFTSGGTLSKDGKIRTETGTMDGADGKKINIRAITTLLDRNTYTYEFYTTGDNGKETKSMEIVYKRK